MGNARRKAALYFGLVEETADERSAREASELSISSLRIVVAAIGGGLVAGLIWGALGMGGGVGAVLFGVAIAASMLLDGLRRRRRLRKRRDGGG